MSRSNGHCMTMGTASTMACVTEALGLCCPAAPLRRLSTRGARSSRRRSGRKIVELVERDFKPSDILTREAFENAIRALHAISGSTNAHPPPARLRGSGRRRAAADAVRRALRVDAVARQPEAGRRAPDGGLLLRGRACRPCSPQISDLLHIGRADRLGPDPGREPRVDADRDRRRGCDPAARSARWTREGAWSSSTALSARTGR